MKKKSFLIPLFYKRLVSFLFAFLILAISSSCFWFYYLDYQVSNSHKIVIVEVDSYRKANSIKSIMPYYISFAYNCKQYRLGVWESTIQEIDKSWKVAVKYNEEFDVFQDLKGSNKSNAYIALMMSFILGIGGIWLLVELIWKQYYSVF